MERYVSDIRILEAEMREARAVPWDLIGILALLTAGVLALGGAVVWVIRRVI